MLPEKVRTWDVGTEFDPVNDWVSAQVDAALEEYFSEFWVHGYFPMLWFPSDGSETDAGSVPPNDALTFRVYMPELPRVQKIDFSLTDELRAMFADTQDGSWREGVAKIVAALRQMADEGEAAIRET